MDPFLQQAPEILLMSRMFSMWSVLFGCDATRGREYKGTGGYIRPKNQLSVKGVPAKALRPSQVRDLSMCVTYPIVRFYREV